MQRIIWPPLLLLILASLLYFSYSYFFTAGKVYVASISSDGHYAVTTDLKGYAILWDLQKHTKIIVDRHANLYSAYFIKNTPYFSWQNNRNNIVYIANTHGDIATRIHPPFASYGQVITPDLMTYVASDIDWTIYKITHFTKPQISLLRKDHAGFLGIGILSNLTLSNDNSYLLSSGNGTDYDKMPLYTGPKQLKQNYHGHSHLSLVEGNVLWNLNTGQPIRKFPGNTSKTYATLSPDEKYIVGGEENQRVFVWSINAAKPLYQLDDIQYGPDVPRSTDGTPLNNLPIKANPSIPPPKDFAAHSPINPNEFLSVKFIDMNGDFLCFVRYAPYAVLYKIGDPKPHKFLFLGTKPFPSINDYSRNHAIDAAPNAHILVTGKAYGRGIIVYRFEVKTQTLSKVWEG
jgi:WD40 repeat protein